MYVYTLGWKLTVTAMPAKSLIDIPIKISGYDLGLDCRHMTEPAIDELFVLTHS